MIDYIKTITFVNVPNIGKGFLSLSSKRTEKEIFSVSRNLEQAVKQNFTPNQEFK